MPRWESVSHQQAEAAGTPHGSIVAIFCALAGALLGGAGAGWQAIIEPGQVIAGLVHYPSENLRYLYLMKIPVLQHYIAAWLLMAGLDERAVSISFSSLLTAAAFQAWGLLILAICRRQLLAMLAPCLIYASLAALRGLNYPIILPPADYGYGGFTITLITLVAAYFAMGWTRAGALLAGLLPVTHPVVGLWGAGIAGLAVLVQYGSRPAETRRAVTWGLIGLVLSALVVWLHFRLFPMPQGLGNAQKQAILDYSRLHDGHRAAIRPSLTLLEVIAAVMLVIGYGALAWRSLGGAQRLLFLLLGINALFAAIATSVYHWPDAWIPVELFSAMPNRFLNINAALFAALLIGILGRERGAASSMALPALLLGWAGIVLVFAPGHAERGTSATLLAIAAMPLALLQPLRPALAGHLPGLLLRIAAVMAIIAGGALLALRAANLLQHWPATDFVVIPLIATGTSLFALMSPDGKGRPLLANAATGLALAVGLIAMAQQSLGLWRGMDDRLAYYQNDAALKASHGRPGLLLFTGDYATWQLWGQLQTRRPVLFDPLTVTALPYLGEQAAAQADLLEQVYGIALFSTDPDCNYVSSPCLRRQWQQRSPGQWAALAASYGFTDILVPRDWELNLPLVAESVNFRLYETGK